VQAPLRIFEPRYRQMIADIADSHRVIGMALLRGNWERDYYANPDFYEIGCAGRIQALVKLPDGQFNLILEGISEFRLLREIREKSYREVEVQWCPVNNANLRTDEATMADLKEMMVSLSGDQAREVWQILVDQRGLRDEELVNVLAFHLDFTPIEKQTLLEALDSRANRLVDILSFKLAERKLGGGTGKDGGSERAQ